MDAKPKFAVVAGGGNLPAVVAQRLLETGHEIEIIGLSGDVQAELFEPLPVTTMPLINVGAIFDYMHSKAATHVVLAGTIQSRPAMSDFRPSFGTLKYIPRVAKALKGGDDGLLSEVARIIEDEGFTLVGAHSIINNHVAAGGHIAGPKPYKGWEEDAKKGFAAAKLLGKLDIGQAAIVAGHRVIATEDLDGTDSLINRVGLMRQNKRLKAVDKAMLVKCPKPQQELRIDMPTIGEKTLECAAQNKVSVIVIEAGAVLVMSDTGFEAKAQKLGISVIALSSTMEPDIDE